MNRSTWLAAVALSLLGTAAHAGDEFDPVTGFDTPASATSAAEVRAQTLKLRQRGPLNVTRDDRLFSSLKRSRVTREQVRAELHRARQDGSMDAFDTAEGQDRALARMTNLRHQ